MADMREPPVAIRPRDYARRKEVWEPQFGAKYGELGGKTGFLGDAMTDLVWVSDQGGAWLQRFDRGALCGAIELGGNAALGGVFEIHGLIYEKWVDVGGPAYGWPTTDERQGSGDGRYNHFTDGHEIYWSQETEAHVVYGAVREKWFELGDAGGMLGYPTSDELDNIDNAATGRRDRCQRFQNGYISWNTDSGAHAHTGGTVSTLTVRHLNIHSIRSGSRDTDVIGLFARVPSQPNVSHHEGLGDFGVGDFDINQSIPFVADDPTASLNVWWLLVNHKDGDTNELDAQLEDMFRAAADKGAAELGAEIGAKIGGMTGGVIGAALGELLGYLAGLTVFANCDGVVAGDTAFISAATWNDAVANGPLIVTKTYPGPDSLEGCGDNSSYEVTWTLT